MSLDEMTEIMKLFSKIETSKLNIEEQLYYMQTVYEFAEKLKPLVTKYAMREQTKSTFL